MQGRQTPVRRHYIRPLALAAVFMVAGAAMLFVLWGVVLHPDGDSAARLLWAIANAIVMAAAIGLMVGFIVGERYKGGIAMVVSSFCYATVLVAGILVNYEIDLTNDLFGFRRDPALFVQTIVLPAILTAPLYGWLLHGNPGKALLARLGL